MWRLKKPFSVAQPKCGINLNRRHAQSSCQPLSFVHHVLKFRLVDIQVQLGQLTLAQPGRRGFQGQLARLAHLGLLETLEPLVQLVYKEVLQILARLDPQGYPLLYLVRLATQVQQEYLQLLQVPLEARQLSLDQQETQDQRGVHLQFLDQQVQLEYLEWTLIPEPLDLLVLGRSQQVFRRF